MLNQLPDPINVVLWIAVGFLALSLVIGGISAVMSLWKSPETEETEDDAQESIKEIGPLLEALTGLVAALGKAPAWFALFIAGLSLIGVAGSVTGEKPKDDGGDKPAAPELTQDSPKRVGQQVIGQDKNAR